MSRTILIPFVFLILLKLFLASVFPVFGDEAYYLYWGSHVSGGYYDLPPMVGWWLSPILKLTTHPFWLRLPNLLVSGVVSFGLFEGLSAVASRKRAILGALLFFFLPLPFLTVISFPDIPLLFFSFCSAVLFFKGVRKLETHLSAELIAAGALMGAAILSKYFAIFLIPAFLIYAWPRSSSKLLGILSFLLGLAPFVFQHLYWNRGHCWSNVVFNLITRQKTYEGTPSSTTGYYLLHLGVVALPVLFSLVRFRDREPEPAVLKETTEAKRFLFHLWLIPVLIFGLTALLGRGQGLHWLLYLTPFFAGWCALVLKEAQLWFSVQSAMMISALLGIGLSVSFADPARTLSSIFQNRYHFEFEWITHPKEWVEALSPIVADSKVVFMDGYTAASLLDYHFKRFQKSPETPKVGVWASESRFGRVFDWTLKWKELEGQRVSVIRTRPTDLKEFEPYFSHVEGVRTEFHGIGVWVIRGEGFRAREFWQTRVIPELKTFYPDVLPGTCSIKEFDHAD